MTPRTRSEASSQDTQHALRLTGTVIGAGLVLSVVVGLLVGWASGDIARGLGHTVTWGMSAAAVVAVLLLLRPARRPR